MPDHSRNIHERFLRHIWSRRYLDESRLTTSDGKPLKVLAPGILNLDGGPDFREARVRIGSVTYAGDVEIHRTVSEWYSHQHQDDPRYNSVILHVVLERGPQAIVTAARSGRAIPVLILSDFLSEPIQSIWQRAILHERARREETIRCYGRNSAVPEDILIGWLQKLSFQRLELKLRRFEERLKELAYERMMLIQEHPSTYGDPPVEGFPDEIPPPHRELTQKDFSRKEIWEQILYEGLLEGLGYSKNRIPFIKLSRAITLQKIRDLKLVDDEHRRIAVLFAVAGLLPRIKAMKEPESKAYVRSLARAWNDVRSSVRLPKLQLSDWQFFPTRPNNFPTLRMSAANALISGLLAKDMFRAIIQSLKFLEDVELTRKRLADLLAIGPDHYWERHFDFDRPTPNRVTALGTSRVHDLLVNTVIPVALLYARIFKDTQVREHTLTVYETFPPAAENSVTRLIQKQLFRKTSPLDSVAKQQGAIQLYNYYCTENRCDDCDVGKTIFDQDSIRVSLPADQTIRPQ